MACNIHCDVVKDTPTSDKLDNYLPSLPLLTLEVDALTLLMEAITRTGSPVIQSTLMIARTSILKQNDKSGTVKSLFEVSGNSAFQRIVSPPGQR